MISLLAPAALGAFCVIYYGPHIWRIRSTRVLRRRAIINRELVLTYDDGPSKSTTPALLDLLSRHHAKATFFMLGHCAAQHTKIADRILAEGHDVGCHSNRHLNAWKVHPWAAVADLNAGYERLSSWVAENGMYRPPYGKMTFPTYVALRQRHATAGWWTIDSGDTHNPLPEPTQVADRLMREGGGVVLMHDLDRSKDRNDFVLETTALLLDIAKRESFHLKRLSEICH